MTVNGREVPAVADLARMRAERHAKLQEQLVARGLDGLVLLGTSAVAYATGAEAPGCDSSRAALLRTVAIVVTGASHPHLFTPYPEGAPPELPADHVHPGAVPDLDDGAAQLAEHVRQLLGPTARIGIDEVPHPLARALTGLELKPASAVLGVAKLHKTVDELACIRQAQHLTERAMLEVQPLLRRPGITQTDLTACFVHHIVGLGAEYVGIDPIWQVMPRTKAAGPWTVHGDLAFPTPSGPQPLHEGDVIWVDTGVHIGGYASDFGRTWIVGPDPTPTPRQQRQFERWLAVFHASLAACRPGVSTLEVARAAIAADERADGANEAKPWIEHFYLAHSVGTDSAEMPMIGTDLGDDFDAAQVLAPGMVLVFEPVIWDDGAAGYRSEDIVAITDDGTMTLSDHPYDPFVAA